MTDETVPTPIDESETALQEARDREKLLRRSRLLGGLIVFIVKLIYRTVRIHFDHPERLDTTGKGTIFVTWHGRSMLPACVFQNRGYWALISLSRDGELQNNVFSRLGFQTIRGSTGRGGVRGLLQMARKVKEGGVLAFTPDGPRGPSHKVQLGVIMMAEKSGVPIVPLGISASRRVLMGSWDRYMLPLPFSRIHFLVGEPITVPARMNDAERNEAAELIEHATNKLEREAERLAGYPDYPAEWPTD